MSHSDSSGGAARAAYRIHVALIKSGIRSLMLVKQKKLEDTSILQIGDTSRKNIFVRLLSYINNKVNNKKQQFTWLKYKNREDVFLSDLRSIPIYRYIQKIEYGILHLHWINLRFLDLNELTKIKKPIVWTLHDCWPFTGICHYFYDCDKYLTSCNSCKFLNSSIENDLSQTIWEKKRTIYENLELHIVCPSNWLANAAKNSELFKSFPVSVIPNPIDTNLFLPGDRNTACSNLNIDLSKKYILFSAFNAVNDKNKGYEKLLEACDILKAKNNLHDLELLVIGAEKSIDEKNELTIPVNYYGILNSDTQVVSAYQAATVMVLPSLSENLSNSIMESLSCGTPVVAFNIGGNSDLIEHKKNGFMAEPFKCDQLADGILYCIENKERLSANGRETVLLNFDEKVVASKYEKLYKSILN